MRSDMMELPSGRTLSWSELGIDATTNVLLHDHGGGSSRLEMAIYDELFTEFGLRVVVAGAPWLRLLDRRRTTPHRRRVG